MEYQRPALGEKEEKNKNNDIPIYYLQMLFFLTAYHTLRGEGEEDRTLRKSAQNLEANYRGSHTKKGLESRSQSELHSEITSWAFQWGVTIRIEFIAGREHR